LRVLGISAFYHDSAAALVCDGKIVAAAQEERFTRKKNDAQFPRNAIQSCLNEGGIKLDALDYIVFYDKPFLKFERLLLTYLATAPRGIKSFSMSMPLWLRQKLFQKRQLIAELTQLGGGFDWRKKLLFSEHHLSHAASAFFPSPFDEAAILTMDGVGEWATTTFGIGRNDRVELLAEINFPHSLGLLYSAFTYYLGFAVNSDEYKIMGLAPYGGPKYVQRIADRLIDLKADGSFRLDLSYFDYCTGSRMTNRRFERLFGMPARSSREPITQEHMDIAASIQAVLEEAVLRITRTLAAETGSANLCLAGGVALNCVANGKVLRDGRFRRVWIQPAAGDAGGAIGAALIAHYLYSGQKKTGSLACDGMNGGYLGPSFSAQEIEYRLKAAGARFTVLNDDDLIQNAVNSLVDGQALGWFQGRMEFGPRALGNRSILADPRSPTMQSTLNLKVKNRESFRPFAPAVLREDLAEWFDMDEDSPYMLFVTNVANSKRRPLSAEQLSATGMDKLKVQRSDIPAVTHVDFSARIQTVHEGTNPLFYRLISAFKQRTGCPVLVNTSFNVKDEPIVCTPEDAFHCFMTTQIEALVVGNCFLNKSRQFSSGN